MEPLSALSLAAAVAQFVDYGFKVVDNAREIYGTLSGATEENLSLETATHEMQRLTEIMVTSTSKIVTDQERMLQDLAAECRSLSSQLLDLLGKIKAKDPESKRHIALAAMKSLLYDKDKTRLRRLEDCQLRLDRLLSVLSRLVPPCDPAGTVGFC